MFGGSVASLAMLGDPDITLITLTELAEQMRRMSRRLDTAGAGRCRPWLWQRAQRSPHGAGTRGGWRRRPHHRGHAAAAGFWRRRAATDFAGRGRRQDEGGAGWPQRSRAGRSWAAPERAAARLASSFEDCVARAQAYEATGVDALFFTGLTTRQRSSRRSRPRPRLPIVLGNTPRRTRRSGLSRQPAGEDRIAGPRAVRRRDAGRL